jgi:hypothetical protein
MPDRPEWVPTVVTAIADVSSPMIFCNAPGPSGQGHQCRTEVKLKEPHDALDAEAGELVRLLLLRGRALSAEAENSRRIDDASGLTLGGWVAVSA